MTLRIILYGIAVVVIFVTSAFLGKAWYDWFLVDDLDVALQREEYLCPVLPAIQIKEQKVHDRLDSGSHIRLNVPT
ncbi:MAG: hypothetical protein K8I82_24505 [Anaerolineae bacterium]|nr:hypothetical protein [Anaerolineae bacterium]